MPIDSTDPLADLEAELEQLGPFMARQAHAEEVEPNDQFVRTLRNRLTGTAEVTSTVPTERVPASSRPARRSLWRRWWAVGGLSLSGAIVAAALLLFINTNKAHSPGAPTTNVAAGVPVPSKSDIYRSYPLPGQYGAGGPPQPYENTLDQPPGAPWKGHLHLNASTLPPGLTATQAYRLQGATFDAPRLGSMAHELGIPGSIQQTTQDGTTWKYVMSRQRSNVHSVAVATNSGELLYHDTAVAPYDFRTHRRPDAADINAARTWLSSLGWPGREMSLHSPTSPQEQEADIYVRLDWAGAGLADIPAAILLMGQGHRVAAARVYPPVHAGLTVSTRTFAAAWEVMKTGTVPVAVNRLLDTPPKSGTGTLRKSALIYVLTSNKSGVMYLVPAYRFSGSASIPGVGPRIWYAIVPALK